jgi:hypothetical protein
MIVKALKILGALAVALFLLAGSTVYLPSGLAKLCPSCALALGYEGFGAVNKFGINLDLDTGVEESIWDADDLPAEGNGPARCFTTIGTTAAAMYVSSDDAADAELGIAIEVLDENWNVSMVAMDLGVAAATTGTVYTQITTGTLLRINRAYATGDAFTGRFRRATRSPTGSGSRCLSFVCPTSGMQPAIR